MASISPHSPIRSRLRLLLRALIGMLLLLLLAVVLAYPVENWRGKRAWEEYKRDLEAKGEVLDWNALMPSPVPDEQNFFKSPKMAEWFVGRGTNALAKRLETGRLQGLSKSELTNTVAATDYLAWSGQFGSDFDLIREAVKRPYARMDGDYHQPQTVPIPNYVTMRTVTETLKQRARCFLLLGQPEKALDELTLVHNLCRILEGRPTTKSITVIAVATACEVSGRFTESIAQGLQIHAWQDTQLIVLQEQLKQANLLPLLVESLKSEQAGFPRMLDYTRTNLPSKGRGLRLFPRGWLYQNYIRNLEMYQELIGCLDLTNKVILARETDSFREKMADYKAFWPYTLFAYIAMPNYTGLIKSLAYHQTQIDEALVACALERYYLANRRYPETIDELAPHFIKELPHDLMNGQPYKYRRTEGGGFVLYSTGWNTTDDGVVACPEELGSQAMSSKDWVWP